MKRMLTVNKTIAPIVMGVALTIAMTGTVEAAGNEEKECTTSTGAYGQTTTTCKVKGVTTEEKLPVKAGVGGIDFLMATAVLAGAGVTTKLVAYLTRKVYILD